MLRHAFSFVLAAPLLVIACVNHGADKSDKNEPTASRTTNVTSADGACWCDEFCKDFGDCCKEQSRCTSAPQTLGAQALAPIGARCSSGASCQSNVCNGVCTISCDRDHEAVCHELAREAHAPHPELAACTDAASGAVCDLTAASAQVTDSPARARRGSPTKHASAATRATAALGRHD